MKFLIFFRKYIDYQADWKMQLGIHLKMCNDHGQKGCLKHYYVQFGQKW